MKNLEIYTNQDRTGTLAKESNKYIFTYDSDANSVVSVTMPVRAESWVSDKLHPIFEMNLPEGALKKIVILLVVLKLQLKYGTILFGKGSMNVEI